MGSKPLNFPDGIAVEPENYSNWSGTVTAQQLWICAPKSPQDVVVVCNWAKAQSPIWTVRPTGARHGWSPLTIGENTSPGANVLLVDTTQYLKNLEFIPAAGDAPPMVTAQAGAKMINLLTFLQYQKGGTGSAMGYSFPHVPAPGSLTVGGVLAINGHGTALPSANEHFPASYGSVSNHIVEFDAVVSSDTAPYDYELRTFKRGDPEAAVLLVHAGRAFITSATLQVIENYNLRCQSMMNIPAKKLFAAPTGGATPIQSLAQFLETSGRVEAIWYPFTENPWLKVWTVEDTQPSGSKKVNSPYNYAFSDHLDPSLTGLLKDITGSNPQLTPLFEKGFAAITATALSFGLEDLWGPSMNTLLYVQDETLRVTANGYAIQMKRGNVQQAVHDFAQKFDEMLQSYAARGQYPINAPLEIRVTGLDDASQIYVQSGSRSASTPLISSLTYDAMARENGYDCAVWFDVLTLPGTPAADSFYTEMEAWFAKRFTLPAARLLPEWSKGWGYTDRGAWSSDDFLICVRNSLNAGRPAGEEWNATVETYRNLDRANLFMAPLLDRLFVPI